VDSSGTGSDKLAVDVANSSAELSNVSQFIFELADQSSTPAQELSNRAAPSGRKRPLGSAGNSLMQISQRNQKQMRKSGGAVKPAKMKQPKAVKGARKLRSSASGCEL
jgi:hypothetical protein